jgi:hypothetical protein
LKLLALKFSPSFYILSSIPTFLSASCYLSYIFKVPPCHTMHWTSPALS